MSVSSSSAAQARVDQDFLNDVLEGLSQDQKTLPCKYLYDAQGSRLFDAICVLDEYYPTRTELAIMEAHIDAIAASLGPDCLLIEYGSGSSIKTRLLLDRVPHLAGYVPIDIACAHLHLTARSLRAAYPELSVHPVCADYTKPFSVPKCPNPVSHRVVYFPGSTIGNFEPGEAIAFLRRIGRVVGTGGDLLIGVDLIKPIAVLEAAYDDKDGVTAEFNLNLLRRINRELYGAFDIAAFKHRAVFNMERSRVEMHLVSLREQSACIGRTRIHFSAGEPIHTESSYKYTTNGFAALAGKAGFDVAHVWTDPQRLFSVQRLVCR